MAPKKASFKEYLGKNFDKMALVGVGGVIIVYFIYALVFSTPKEVKVAREEIQKTTDKINDFKSSVEIPPVNKESYIEKMNAPLSKVPAATLGPAWASYKLPYIMKTWELIPVRFMKHPAPAISKLEDKIRKVAISFTAGTWQEGDKAKCDKFEVLRSTDEKTWTTVAEIPAVENQADYNALDSNVGENTEYKYRVTSYASITDNDSSMYKLDSDKVDSPVAAVKTQFTFRISKINWPMDEKFRKNKIVQLTVNQLMNEDTWVEWQCYVSVEPLKADDRDKNPFVSAGKTLGPEIKFTPETNPPKVKAIDENGKPLVPAKYVTAPAKSFNIGYVVADIASDSPTDMTKEKIITLTLKKPGQDGTVVFKYQNNNLIKE